MRKISAYLLTLILAFSFFPSDNVEAASSFPDVDRYETYISYLYENDIIQGYDDGTFKPQKDLKRLQGVQMIINALDIPLGDAPNPGFSDVQPGDYGYDYIAKAAQLDIIGGYPDGTFGSFNVLKRGQMASILTNAFNFEGNLTYSFKDVPDYLDPAVNALRDNGISAGYPDNTFRPFETISREHFSIFLAKTLNDSLRGETTTPGEAYTIDRGAVIQNLVANHQYQRIGSTSAKLNAQNPNDTESGYYNVLLDMNSPNNIVMTLTSWSVPDQPWSSIIAPSVRSALQSMIPSGASKIYRIMNEVGTTASQSVSGLGKTYSYDGYEVTVTFGGGALQLFIQK